jgi:type I restriction enzyme S subunit
MWNMFYKNNIMYNYEGKTNGIKNLLIDSVLANYWVFPTDQIAEIFSKYINVFFALKDKNVDEMLYLTNLRDALLPLLMNGQVTLSNIENTVDSVIPFKTTSDYDQKFNLWLQNKGLAARGDIDRQTLREIFDTMDDNDK